MKRANYIRGEKPKIEYTPPSYELGKTYRRIGNFNDHVHKEWIYILMGIGIFADSGSYGRDVEIDRNHIKLEYRFAPLDPRQRAGCWTHTMEEELMTTWQETIEKI